MHVILIHIKKPMQEEIKGLKIGKSSWKQNSLMDDTKGNVGKLHELV